MLIAEGWILLEEQGLLFTVFTFLRLHSESIPSPHSHLSGWRSPLVTISNPCFCVQTADMNTLVVRAAMPQAYRRSKCSC
ncbi:MAG: hypothetical protein MJK14_09725 [Rivularia sp. ALOHA_DT_140]|nr:hypothetical protein [Rivularia sp. ALOHA_DT_140]